MKKVAYIISLVFALLGLFSFQKYIQSSQVVHLNVLGDISSMVVALIELVQVALLLVGSIAGLTGKVWASSFLKGSIIFVILTTLLIGDPVTLILILIPLVLLFLDKK